MTQPDKLVVTQEAREAAADALCGNPPLGFDAGYVGQHIRQGTADDQPIVQAFQRAMTQAADERQEMCAKVADAAIKDFALTDAENKSPGNCAAVAYHAIRSIGEGGM